MKDDKTTDALELVFKHSLTATIMTIMALLFGFILFIIANTYDHHLTTRPYVYNLGGFWFLVVGTWITTFIMNVWYDFNSYRIVNE